MNAQQYKTASNKLLKRYSVELSTYLGYTHKIQLSYGTLYLTTEYTPRIKVGNIHSRFDGDLKKLKEETGYNINTYNGKLNFYFNNPTDLLYELEEFINNILLLEADEKRTEEILTEYNKQ